MTDDRPYDNAMTPRPALTCPLCESERLITRHCKRICEQCGYVESCEDSFLPNQDNPKEVARPAP